jgi:molybdate transport repressor ModE-like protein
MHTNFRQLLYVVACAEAGSIRAAAKEVGISEPAISAAIKEMESMIGYRLFNRTTSRGLSLTPAGRQFVAYGRRLLGEVKAFEKSALELNSEICGRVHVGCYAVPAPFILPGLLEDLRSRYSGIVASIHESTLPLVLEDLKSGNTDVALTYDVYRDGDIEFEPLFDVTSHVILGCDHPLSGREKISIYELAEHPFILLDLPMSASHHEFVNILDAYGVTPKIAFRVKSFEMVRSLVAAGFGYSFGRLPLKNDVTYDGRRIVRRPLLEETAKFRMCLAYQRGGSHARAVSTVMAVCRESLCAARFLPVQ